MGVVPIDAASTSSFLADEALEAAASLSARLEALVRAPDLMPSEATGAALAAALAKHVRGAAVLVPRGAAVVAVMVAAVVFNRFRGPVADL